MRTQGRDDGFMPHTALTELRFGINDGDLVRRCKNDRRVYGNLPLTIPKILN